MENVIGDIRKKVGQLLEERSRMAEEMKQKDEALNALQHQLDQTQQQIDELEKANHTLKIAKSLTGAEDNTEAKQKINELVREIDKCIALLNK
ncbi:hypothetical protein [Sanyastnella coralliicola]|uniref:hypothetical protein n=1 Tax=Sanyastnella coralliicola TaxID=3069118 RepID=UPI0027B94D86|nr:hypothetical protein [Longitalea sp. SCSIO 12813]